MAFTKEIIDFSELSADEVQKKLTELNIPLTVEETLKIQNEMLGRAPSLAELVLFSIQGSEHCSYKSSRKHLKQFTTEGPDVVLGAKEDAGIVAIAKDTIGRRWCIVMSHESHNHPSQIVPYEGAATGVGGNVRDVMCMGAEVIACTDSFRFGDIKNNRTKWIHDGVVAELGSLSSCTTPADARRPEQPPCTIARLKASLPLLHQPRVGDWSGPGAWHQGAA